MSNISKFFSTLATKVPALDVAHNVTLAEIDGIAVKTIADLALVNHRLPYVAATFVPLGDRDAVVESLGRLSTRVGQCNLNKKDVDFIVKKIALTAKTIKGQVEKMPKATNGAGAAPQGHRGDLDDSQRVTG